ncbi:MAG: helicase-associated domain-containing protein [Polyangia bacterium]|nr:helicase-associated domain-containing protein [Polyangia bacterium]
MTSLQNRITLAAFPVARIALSRYRNILRIVHPPRSAGAGPTVRDLRATVGVPTMHRILQALDPSYRGREKQAPERLADLLGDPGRLLAALCRLPGPALALLEILTEIPDRSIPLEVARREVERRLGRSGVGTEAETQLTLHSLLLQIHGGAPQVKGRVILPWTLASPIRPLVRGLTLRFLNPGSVTITRPASSQDVLFLAAAVLSGSFQREMPKVTQRSELYARTKEQLTRIFFPGDDPPGTRLDLALSLARKQGALALSPGEARARRAAWETKARRDADQWRETLARIMDALPSELRMPLRDLVVQLRNGFLPVELIRSALEVQRHATPSSGNEGYYFTYPTFSKANQRAQKDIELLRAHPFLALGVTESGEDVLGLPSPVPSDTASRAYVQPNLEIILPPGTDPLLAFDAARISEVRRVEAVCLLALTERSIRQAREDGLSAQDILAILERVAPGAVPDNVRITVAGWASGPASARLIRASVLHCQDPAAIERLRRGDLLPRGALELAPGVWALPTGSLETTSKALRSARIDLRSRIEELGSPDGVLGGIRFKRGWYDEDGWEEDLENEWEEEGYGAPGGPAPDLEATENEEQRLGPVPDPDPALLARVAQSRLSPQPPPLAPTLAPTLAPVLPLSHPEQALPPPPLTKPVGVGMMPLSGTLFEDVVLRRAATGEPLGIEVKQGDGTVVRYQVQVDGCTERRGIRFLEGRRLDTQEDVSVPLGQILRMQVFDDERDMALDLAALSGSMPFRRDVPKVGRNEPCPCGSGRKYKKCCGKRG